MDAMSGIRSVAKAVVPPRNSHPSEQYWWRLRIAIISGGALLLSLGVTLIAFGAIPSVYAGVASKKEVSNVVTEIRENRLSDVEGSLLDLRVKHCKAPTEEAKQLYWKRISDLMDEYRKLSGHNYRLPACGDLS